MSPSLPATPVDRPLRPAAKALLAGEILAGYVRVRLLLRRRDIRGTLAALRRVRAEAAPRSGPPAADPLRAGRRLGHAVTRTLRVLPTDGRCLMRSLVLTRLLARRGIEGTLVLGVAPGERLFAHAWVEHDGRPLLEPGGPGMERLAEL